MKILAIAVILLQLTLSGCVYSSSNLMRVKGEDVMVFGAWGYVHCKNSAITMYRSTDTMSYLKDKDAKYPRVPARPTVTEDGTDITIGKIKADSKAIVKEVVGEPTPAPEGVVNQ